MRWSLCRIDSHALQKVRNAPHIPATESKTPYPVEDWPQDTHFLTTETVYLGEDVTIQTKSQAKWYENSLSHEFNLL